MKSPLVRRQLVVKKSLISGYGVFAEECIAAGDIIEECHVLLTDELRPEFMDYYFKGGENSVLALGFGTIYNHADSPNAGHCYDPESRLLIFKAKQAIAAGEEIFTSYGDRWFVQRQMEKIEPTFRYKCKKILRWLLPTFRFSFIIALLIAALMVLRFFQK